MSLQDAQAHPLYHQLSPTMGRFVDHYIKTQDMVSSIEYAGSKCKTVGSKTRLARKFLRHPNVKHLLGLALDYSTSGGILTRDECLLILSDAIRDYKGAIKLNATRLYAEIKGWIDSKKKHGDLKNIVLEIESQRKNLGG